MTTCQAGAEPEKTHMWWACHKIHFWEGMRGRLWLSSGCSQRCEFWSCQDLAGSICAWQGACWDRGSASLKAHSLLHHSILHSCCTVWPSAWSFSHESDCFTAVIWWYEQSLMQVNWRKCASVFYLLCIKGVCLMAWFAFALRKPLWCSLFIPCFSVRPGMFLLLLWRRCCYSQFIKSKKNKLLFLSLKAAAGGGHIHIHTLSPECQNIIRNGEDNVLKQLILSCQLCEGSGALSHHVSEWFLQELILFFFNMFEQVCDLWFCSFK